MDQRAVEAKKHAENLAKTKGTPEFEHHYKKVKKLLKHEVHAIANHLTGKTPKNWSKGAMLGKIYAEHGREMLNKN